MHVEIRTCKHVLQAGDLVFGHKKAVDRHSMIGSDQSGWMQRCGMLDEMERQGDRPVSALQI
jgi:hypothetical protein